MLHKFKHQLLASPEKTLVIEVTLGRDAAHLPIPEHLKQDSAELKSFLELVIPQMEAGLREIYFNDQKKRARRAKRADQKHRVNSSRGHNRTDVRAASIAHGKKPVS